MIGLLILAQEDLGKGLLHSIEHVLGELPPQLETLPVNYHAGPEALRRRLSEHLKRLDQGQGVLILADIYGASHTNAACQLLVANRIELVSGVNLPMLIRILNYRDLGLAALVQKALSGGSEGIVSASQPLLRAKAGI
ncbi:MAG TPA: PTS sugar transporter subunit IIA [Acidiferrobacterales bacterium]|jgi:PTS system ascorbate-specific IIA component